MAEDDVVRIKVGMSVSYIAGSMRESTVEIPREEWDAMTPEKRQQALGDIAKAEIESSVDAWAYVDEEP